MTVCYLEADDEITGAIGRIRAVQDGDAIIVVPPGSRIATSRINFKLLVREGNERGLNLIAVSDEPSTRALALSAGLPAYDSLPAAQQALASFREQDRRLAERLGRQPAEEAVDAPASAPRGAARMGDAEATQVLPPSAVGRGPREHAREASRTPAPAVETAAPPRRIGATPIIGAVVLLLLLAGVGYGAYMFLPTATITLQPRTTSVQQAPITVVADPAAAVIDVDAGVVPAERLALPVTVADEFATTGVQARETRSTGVVRFRSENTLNEVPILEGTVVSTTDGVEFETTEPAVVPRADFATATPGTVDVAVRARRTGPSGNVPQGSITELGAGLRQQLVSARNPDPTSGGRRIEEQVVSEADYDSAVADLRERLATEMAIQLADPDNTPRGLTLFPETAALGDSRAEQGRGELVGTVAITFSLSVTSTATVLAVNESLVDELAEARLRESLAAGQSLVGDAVTTTRSPGTASGETVVFDASPTAMVYADPDLAALRAAVRGKSISEARLILAPYGMVEITIWPEFVDRLPDQTARISIVVVTPSPRP